MDERNELEEEWRHEIQARDHSLRQIGAVVIELFDRLQEQDEAVGSGRAGRSTAFGTLIHDTLTNVQNYHVRTKVIDKLAERRRELRKATR